MEVIHLIVTALILFMSGSALVYSGYSQDEKDNEESDDDIVPISDPEEIQEFKEQYAPEAKNAESVVADETAEDEVELPVLKLSDDEPSPASDVLTSADESQDESSPELDEERPSLNLTPVAESTVTEIQDTTEPDTPTDVNPQQQLLEDQLRDLRLQIDEQAREANQKIQDLTQSKQDLERALEEERAKSHSSAEPSVDEEQLKQQAERLTQAEGSVVRLTGENSRLLEQVKEQTDSMEALKGEIDALKNAPAQPRAEDQARIDELQAQLTQVNQSQSEELGRVQAEQERLKQELDGARQELEAERQKLAAANDNKSEELKQQFESQRTELEQENQRLAQQVADHNAQIVRLQEETEKLREESRVLREQEGLKTEALQAEINQQKEQLHAERQADVAAIDKLKNEKQSLLDAEAKDKATIAALEHRINEMNQSLQEEINKAKQRALSDASEEKRKLANDLTAMEEKMAFSKITYEQKIIDLNSELYKIKSTMPAEGTGTAQQVESLEAELKKLKDTNSHLLEKERTLVYELSKSRAQAAGLEKICQDFKRQMMEAAKARNKS